MKPGARRSTTRAVVLAVACALVLLGAEVAAFVSFRAALDRRADVSDLRIEAALETFRAR